MSDLDTHWRFNRRTSVIDCESTKAARAAFWDIMSLGPLVQWASVAGEESYRSMLIKTREVDSAFRSTHPGWVGAGVPCVVPCTSGTVWIAGGDEADIVLQEWHDARHEGWAPSAPSPDIRGIMRIGRRLTFMSGREDGRGSATQWGWAVEAGVIRPATAHLGGPAHPVQAAGAGNIFRGDPEPVRRL